MILQNYISNFHQGQYLPRARASYILNPVIYQGHYLVFTPLPYPQYWQWSLFIHAGVGGWGRGLITNFSTHLFKLGHSSPDDLIPQY